MNTRTGEREVIVRWDDPQDALAQLPTSDGIDLLRQMSVGELPQAAIASHMNMKITAVEHGTVTFQAWPDHSHYNPLGTVHGGYMCTLLDSALGCAVHSTLSAGTGYTSIELKTNFLRSVSAESGPLTCTGRVVKPGRRVAFAEAEVTDADGRTVATASGSLLVFPLPAAGS